MPNWQLVIEHAWEAPGNEEWNTTYEIGGAGATSAGALTGVINAIIGFERQIHLTPVFFIRARVGSYAPAVSGYDPFRFTNIPIGSYGLRGFNTGQENVDLELVWKVGRVPVTGNNGFCNYRGVLQENETTARATGRPKLVATSPTVAGGLFISNMNSALAAYLGTSASIFIAMIGEYKIGGSEEEPIYGPTVARRVNNFTVHGAGRLKLTKRHYERKGPDVGDGVSGGGSGGPFITTYAEPAAVDTIKPNDFTFNSVEPLQES